jgi:hypothetical protein
MREAESTEADGGDSFCCERGREPSHCEPLGYFAETIRDARAR